MTEKNSHFGQSVRKFKLLKHCYGVF